MARLRASALTPFVTELPGSGMVDPDPDPSSSVPEDLLSVLHGVRVLVRDSASLWLLEELALERRERVRRRRRVDDLKHYLDLKKSI